MHRTANGINPETTVNDTYGPAEEDRNDQGLDQGYTMGVEKVQRGGRFMRGPTQADEGDLTWSSNTSMQVRSGNQDPDAIGVNSSGVIVEQGGGTEGERLLDAFPEDRDAFEAGIGAMPRTGDDPLAKIAPWVAGAALAYLLYSLWKDKRNH
jgi:hypothetical protein